MQNPAAPAAPAAPTQARTTKLVERTSYPRLRDHVEHAVYPTLEMAIEHHDVFQSRPADLACDDCYFVALSDVADCI